MSIQGLRKGSDAELNVTPLIDVLLVLLIIFMVLLPHHQLGERAEIPQPSPKTITPEPEDNIVLQLHDAGAGEAPTLKINAENVSWSELEARLGKIYEARADKTAFLRGDPEIDFEYVAEAVDVSHRAGANRVGLMSVNRR